MKQQPVAGSPAILFFPFISGRIHSLFRRILTRFVSGCLNKKNTVTYGNRGCNTAGGKAAGRTRET
jgi:hypothetical protein